MTPGEQLLVYIEQISCGVAPPGPCLARERNGGIAPTSLSRAFLSLVQAG